VKCKRCHTITKDWKLLALIGLLVIVGATLDPAHPSFGRSATSARADTFAAIQFTPVNHQIDLNRDRLTKLIVEARQRGARYVVTPELALMGTLRANSNGHHNQSAPNAESIPGPTTDYFAKYARMLGIWLVISLPEKVGAKSDYFLTTILLNDKGELVSKYRKLMVPSDQEDGGASRGNYRDMIDTFDDHGLRVGIMSGDDIQIGVPRLADRGADTILISAAWSDRDIEQWDQLCRRLSKQYSVNLVVANRGSARESKDVGANKFSGIYASDGRVFLPGKENPADLVLAPLAKRKVAWQIKAAIGLPSVPVPSIERMSYEMAELGRLLFFDPNLSSTGKVSCSTCHQPEKAFSNGEPKGTGVHGRQTRRNVPSLFNIAYRPLLRWDGYASSIENFMKYPINGFSEMDFHYLDKVPAYLRSQPLYVNALRSTMAVEEIEFDHVARALAAYQRSLISGNSAFDRYYYGKDKSALSKSAQWGLKLFTGKAECSKCHTIGNDYSLFMDHKYHDLGVSWDLVKKEYGDRGLAEISTNDQAGLFLTPSLRNVAQTAPYMHDGSLKTLDEVIDFFNRGGVRSPNRDPIMKPLRLTSEEKRALVAFLESLTGDQKYSAAGQRLNQETITHRGH
jgi:cytochrome c peroxidase